MDEIDIPIGKVRINVWIAKKTHDGLLCLSDLENRSISDLIREAARDYLAKHQSRLNGGNSHGDHGREKQLAQSE